MTEQNSVNACPQCDALHVNTVLQPGETATCGQCATSLYRYTRFGINEWIALVSGAILLFVLANFLPIVKITLQGLSVQPTFFGAAYFTWQQGHYLLALLTGLVGIWAPLFYLLFRFWALLVIQRGVLPNDFALAMRVLSLLQHWSLVPVVFLGIIVAMVKFANMAKLEFSLGIFAYAALMLVYTATLRLSPQRLWLLAAQRGLVVDTVPFSTDNYVSCHSCGLVQNLSDDEAQHCLRCEQRIHKRKPDMRARAWALMITAWVLYIPANILPMMLIRTPLGWSSHTILGGVIELWESGSPDLALIVFTASIVVPFIKFVILTILLICCHQWKGRVIQRQRTRLYEIVEFIGQWSMLDVFVVVLMGAMADFPGLSQIIAGPAALCFGLVVVMTMVAAMCFDPRVGWDARQHRVATPTQANLAKHTTHSTVG